METKHVGKNLIENQKKIQKSSFAKKNTKL
jgi:hypothetical protein